MNKQPTLDKEKHYYSIPELFSEGFTYYSIKKMAMDGNLIRLNRQMYENSSYNGESSDYVTAQIYIPNGIICMMSAARYYGLTNYLPEKIDVAIERDMKISTVPEWPQVNIWYFPEKRYASGRSVHSDCDMNFNIYDIEKTVVDILYYRNKVGIEETKEIIRKYLGREDINLIKLHQYAETLGCRKILDTYLEVLL